MVAKAAWVEGAAVEAVVAMKKAVAMVAVVMEVVMRLVRMAAREVKMVAKGSATGPTKVTVGWVAASVVETTEAAVAETAPVEAVAVDEEEAGALEEWQHPLWSPRPPIEEEAAAAGRDAPTAHGTRHSAPPSSHDHAPLVSHASPQPQAAYGNRPPARGDVEVASEVVVVMRRRHAKVAAASVVSHTIQAAVSAKQLATRPLPSPE